MALSFADDDDAAAASVPHALQFNAVVGFLFKSHAIVISWLIASCIGLIFAPQDLSATTNCHLEKFQSSRL